MMLLFLLRVADRGLFATDIDADARQVATIGEGVPNHLGAKAMYLAVDPVA